MSDLTKFLADDHTRLRRSFVEYRRRPNNLDAALNVCDHLWIHLTLEVELAHPAVEDDMAPADSEVLNAADDGIHRLMATIDSLEAKDPSVSRHMASLERAVGDHIGAYESYVLPKLSARPDVTEMGGTAFRRWQELFEERPPRTWTPMKRLANTGWGGGGRFANSGW
jgi:hypothetical protein